MRFDKAPTLKKTDRDHQEENLDRRLGRFDQALEIIAQGIETAVRKSVSIGVGGTVYLAGRVIERGAKSVGDLTERALTAAGSGLSQIGEKIADTKLTRKQISAGLLGGMLSISPISHDDNDYIREVQTEEVSQQIDLHNFNELRKKGPAWLKVLENVPDHEFFESERFDWFRDRKSGEFSEVERKKFTEVLKNGEVIFRDHAQVFYKVQKGDTIKNIIDKLKAYPEFSHLKNQSGRSTKYINIDPKDLKVGMWLPIPLDPEKRKLSEEQLLKYIVAAILDLSERDTPYKEMAKKVITDHKLFDKVIVSMFAVGFHEAGSTFPGEFSLHRYESGHKAFSFSHFHVLMKDWGLVARKKLQRTEGQALHPINGAQMMFAYLVDKSKNPEVRRVVGFDDFSDIFPITDKNINKFSHFYNGAGYKKNNYDSKINTYRQKASNLIARLQKNDKTKEAE
jgi:hypothetical protein